MFKIYVDVSLLALYTVQAAIWPVALPHTKFRDPKSYTS